MFDVTVQCVGKWLENGAPPRGDRGYDLRAWIEWRENRKRGGAEEANLQLKTQNARLAKLKADKEEGLLIPKSESKDRHEGLCRKFRAVMDQLPGEMRTRLARKSPSQIASALKSWANKKLAALVGE